MANPSLSARLLRHTAALLVAVMLLAGGAYAATVHWGMAYVTERELARSLRQLMAGLRFDAGGRLTGVTLPVDKHILYDALPLDIAYRVIDAGGTVRYASDHGSTPFAPAGATGPVTPGLLRIAPNGLPMYVLTAPVAHSVPPYYVQVARSERFERLTTSNDGRMSWKVALSACLVALACFGAVIWLTFRRALRSLRTASDAAAHIAPDNLAARFSTAHMPAEVLPLVHAFNAALARVEHGYQVQQAFLATAAHELKTPLALMRGQLELHGASEPAVLLQDVDRMSRQVQQLLNLAECSEQHNYVYGPVHLYAAVQEAAQRLSRLAGQRDVTIAVACAAPATVLRADIGALFVLLKNLLENAIHHTAAGHVVDVLVTAQSVVVANPGMPIAAADLPLLFDRYWRGAHRRDDGAGLGLAICREIASAHHWRLDAHNGAHGPTFTVAFAA